jgi:hypothetical protein
VISRVPAATDAFLAALTAAGIKNWDGPTNTGDFAPAVYVGYDADPEGTFESVVMDQEWAALGARARREVFDIVCAIVVLSGDDITVPLRTAVFQLFGEVETVLRTDPSLGQPPPFVASAKPKQLFTEDTADGLQGRLVFHVHVETRI